MFKNVGEKLIWLGLILFSRGNELLYYYNITQHYYVILYYIIIYIIRIILIITITNNNPTALNCIPSQTDAFLHAPAMATVVMWWKHKL